MIKRLTTSFLFFLVLAMPLASAQGVVDPSTLLEEDQETLADRFDTDSVMHEYDGNTQLVDYEFTLNNRSIFIFRSKTPRVVTIFDINAISETNREEPPVQTFSLGDGLTAVEMDLVSDTGDKTVLTGINKNYYSISNDRTSALIGMPQDQLGFILGILGGGISVMLLIIGRIKWSQHKIDKGGIRTD